jgi:septum formation protein
MNLLLFFMLLSGYSGDRAFAVNYVLVTNLSTGVANGGWDIPEVVNRIP